MQVIYAAPFVLIGVASFFIALAVPKWRFAAFSALISPLAFGFCSIAGMALVVLIAQMLPATERYVGVTAGLLCYVLAGSAGVWGSILLVRAFERRVLSRPEHMNLALRAVISTIVAGFSFVLAIAILDALVNAAFDNSEMVFVGSCVVAAVSAFIVFIALGCLSRRSPTTSVEA